MKTQPNLGHKEVLTSRVTLDPKDPDQADLLFVVHGLGGRRGAKTLLALWLLGMKAVKRATAQWTPRPIGERVKGYMDEHK